MEQVEPQEHLHHRRRLPVILLVDDDDEVREMVAEILRSEGMRVLELPGGHEALRLMDRLGAAVDLVLTDVRMPSMDGRELAARLAERWPSLTVLFMSGYPGEYLARQGGSAPPRLLGKPFTVDQLMSRVREALGGDELTV